MLPSRKTLPLSNSVDHNFRHYQQLQNKKHLAITSYRLLVLKAGCSYDRTL